MVKVAKAVGTTGLLLVPGAPLATGARVVATGLGFGASAATAAAAYVGVGAIGRQVALSQLLRLGRREFHISRLEAGDKHAVIVVNGFLSEGNTDLTEWTTHRSTVFSDASWYHLDWAASTKSHAVAQTVPGIASVMDLGGFRAAKARAEVAGRALAQVLSQTPDWTFTLAGHSLGARVVVNTLAAMKDDR